MQKTIEAVFENGVFRPLEEVDIKEHQKVEIVLKPRESAVDKTKGIIKADPKTIEEVAISHEYEMEL